MSFSGKHLFNILSKIGNKNASGEFYLTDAVEVAKQMGLKCTAFSVDPEEVAGANTLEELAKLEEYCRKNR